MPALLILEAMGFDRTACSSLQPSSPSCVLMGGLVCVGGSSSCEQGTSISPPGSSSSHCSACVTAWAAGAVSCGLQSSLLVSASAMCQWPGRGGGKGSWEEENLLALLQVPLKYLLTLKPALPFLQILINCQLTECSIKPLLMYPPDRSALFLPSPRLPSYPFLRPLGYSPKPRFCGEA